MTGVTPREAQAHKDKGGKVMALDAVAGTELDATHLGFANLPNQDTPRPQWRLVPIPERTVTIEVPKRWAEQMAEKGWLGTHIDDDEIARQACIKAVES